MLDPRTIMPGRVYLPAAHDTASRHGDDTPVCHPRPAPPPGDSETPSVEIALPHALILYLECYSLVSLA